MKKIDLYDYLETLDNKEWNQFRKFLLLTKKEDTYEYKLFDYLNEQENGFPDLPKLQKNLFPHLSTKAISNKCSSLKKHLTDYFIWRQLASKDTQHEVLHEALLSRSLYGHATKLRKKIVKKIKKSKKLSIPDFYTLHRLYHQSFFSFSPDKYIYGDLLLEKSEKLISSYHELVSLQYKIEKANRKKIQFTDRNPQALEKEEMRESIESLTSIMKSVLAMIQSDSHQEYQKIYTYLFDHKTNQASELYIMILMLAIQFRFREIRANYHTLDKDLLYLYLLGLEVDAFTYRGYISARVFANIIDLMCALNETKQAMHAIQDYANKIQPRLKNDVVLLAECQILMAQEKYADALARLEDLHYQNIDLEMRYRWLKLACLYEENDKRFESFRNSFRIWVKRAKTKLTPGVKEALLNFISLTTMIARGTPTEEIKKEYESKKKIMFRSWLDKKINQ